MPRRDRSLQLFRRRIVGGLVLPWVGLALAGPATSPPPANPERVQRGKGLYMKHCASCHGATGAGDGAAGHDLDPKPSDLRDVGKSDIRLFRQITRGRAPMPSFGRLLSDDDRWAVVGYVKTLDKGK